MLLFTLLLASKTFGPYTDLKIEGWNVKVESSEMKDATWAEVRQELTTQLYRISHVVPDGPLSKLRKITIWIHTDDAATKCMAYHPAPEWLKEHGSNPAMAHGVEIANAKNFISWTYEQPWMVLHELSHAYHHQFLPDGFDNKEVKSVWDEEMALKKYDHVLHWDGKTVKHYAETNPMEFFAECTEAYFGENDFYPFVNAELKTFDPEAYHLMQQVWGTPQKRL
ncbi:MAG TPA: hypothetical protein VHE55_12875 [Fimbriimonadaceae bacterium]|nr:hypothetical protein [Fimbriimonadaceae bacterium]